MLSMNVITFARSAALDSVSVHRATRELSRAIQHRNLHAPGGTGSRGVTSRPPDCAHRAPAGRRSGDVAPYLRPASVTQSFLEGGAPSPPGPGTGTVYWPIDFTHRRHPGADGAAPSNVTNQSEFAAMPRSGAARAAAPQGGLTCQGTQTPLSPQEPDIGVQPCVVHWSGLPVLKHIGALAPH